MSIIMLPRCSDRVPQFLGHGFASFRGQKSTYNPGFWPILQGQEAIMVDRFIKSDPNKGRWQIGLFVRFATLHMPQAHMGCINTHISHLLLGPEA